MASHLGTIKAQAICRLSNFSSTFPEVGLSDSVTIVRNDRLGNYGASDLINSSGYNRLGRPYAYKSIRHHPFDSEEFLVNSGSSEYSIHIYGGSINKAGREDFVRLTRRLFGSAFIMLAIVRDSAVFSAPPLLDLEDTTIHTNGRVHREVISKRVLENSILESSENMELGENEVEFVKKLFETIVSSTQTNIPVSGFRLLGARSSARWEDKIIDVSVAIEALYQKDKEDLTFKLSQRAAVHGASSHEERLRIRDCIKKLYGLRSRIVHGGKPVADPFSQTVLPQDIEIVRSAYQIARKGLLKCVLAGNPPDLVDQLDNEALGGTP